MKSLFYLFVILRIVHMHIATTDKEERFTRIITLKQGDVRGRIVKPKRVEQFFSDVEVYLGIPYAAPPIGTLRFMPPGAPQPWDHLGILSAVSMKPVCPQMLPNLDNLSQKKMIPERYEFIKRMKMYLKNENEDCLYLNIYVPKTQKEEAEHQKYPVIMFIHGESFEWNSGNLYDGSVVASYGKVIFITINFRLGIFGFLKHGLQDGRSNFGLSDQIAALQWIKGNIAEFGGDPTRITIMGHDTGAICANFLMLSPVADGLFHRAILMSGSALSEWALTTTSFISIQLAEQLNCPTEKITDCLVKKRKEDIVAAFKRDDSVPFENSLTPVADDVVVLNTPAGHMEKDSSFKKYDLLAGVNEIESYYLLEQEFIKSGMVQSEASKLLDIYSKAIYKKTPDIVLIKTIEKYLVHSRDKSPNSTRNAVLDALSDMLVTAPVIQTVRYHAVTPKNTYFYVFGHHTFSENYLKINKSVTGDDLPYALGIPLYGPNHQYLSNYNFLEEQLSEKMLRYFTNFAKTGNPNHPLSHDLITYSPISDYKHTSIRWPSYKVDTHPYLYFGIPIQIRHHYREEFDKFWNQVLPSTIKGYTGDTIDDGIRPEPPYESDFPLYEMPSSFPPDLYNPFNNFNKPTINTENSILEAKVDSSSITVTILVIVGIIFLLINIIAFSIIYYQRNKLRVHERLFKNRFRCKSVSVPDIFEENDTNDIYVIAERTNKNRNNKMNNERNLKLKLFGRSSKKCSLKVDNNNYDNVRVASVNPEAITGKRMKRWRLTRQGSGSTITMDPHSKVRNWIAQEIVKCSPRFFHKNKQCKHSGDNANLELNTLSANSKIKLTTSSIESKKKLQMDKEKVRKVSIAVDATPAARTESVLRQIPVELTKSLDNGKKPLSSNPMRSSTSMTCIRKKSLQRSKAFTSEDSEDYYRKTGTHKSSAHIRLRTPEYLLDSNIFTSHSYTKSDPSHLIVSCDSLCSPVNIEPIYSQIDKTKKLKSFDDTSRNASIVDSVASTSHYEDINVITSEQDFPVKREPLSNVAFRNFPKVLPDFPQSIKKNNRLSLPSSCFSGNKRYYDCYPTRIHRRIPPAPPPRKTSTLDRNIPSFDSDKQCSHITVQLKKCEPVIIEEKFADIIQTESCQVPKTSAPVEY